LVSKISTVIRREPEAVYATTTSKEPVVGIMKGAVEIATFSPPTGKPVPPLEPVLPQTGGGGFTGAPVVETGFGPVVEDGLDPVVEEGLGPVVEEGLGPVVETEPLPLPPIIASQQVV
jgi:hypothetical protein